MLGVIIEAAADPGESGHDILAVYADRSALYLDHKGRGDHLAAGGMRGSTTRSMR